MRAAVYTRVSSDEQATLGHSPETQRDLCAKYAEANGLDVVKVYSDSVSGATLDRPGLVDMLAAAGTEFTAVVCHANDRLSRKPEHQAEILRRLLVAGCDLHFVTTGRYDPESPEAVLLLGLLSNFADYWREKIRMNARLDKRRKAIRGEVTLNDVAPYGYSMAGGKLTIVDAEAEVVRRIFDLYAHSGSVSLEKVARLLQGTPSPSDSGHGPAGFAKSRKAGKGVWNTSMIRRILQSTVYSGKWVYGLTRKRIDGVRVRNGETVIVDVPPIVSTATQEKALARLAENRQRRDGKAKRRDYLLSGHIRCGTCGLAYTGLTTIHADVLYPYYRCSGTTKRGFDGEGRRCGNPTIRAEWIEEQAKMFLAAIYSTPDISKELANRFMDEMVAEDPGPERIARLDARLKTIEGKRARLLGALESAGTGQSARAIGKSLADLDADEAAAKAEKRELEAAPKSVFLRDQDVLREVLPEVVGDMLSRNLTDAASPFLALGLVSKAEFMRLEMSVDPAEVAAAHVEFFRVRAKQAKFRATVLANGTVDFQAYMPSSSGPSTVVQSNVLAFWTLKRPD